MSLARSASSHPTPVWALLMMGLSPSGGPLSLAGWIARVLKKPSEGRQLHPQETSWARRGKQCIQCLLRLVGGEGCSGNLLECDDLGDRWPAWGRCSWAAGHRSCPRIACFDFTHSLSLTRPSLACGEETICWPKKPRNALTESMFWTAQGDESLQVQQQLSRWASLLPRRPGPARGG